MATCGKADVSKRRPRTPRCPGAAFACPANLALRGGTKKRWLAEDGAFEAPTQTQAGVAPSGANGGWGSGEDERPAKKARASASAGGGDEGMGEAAASRGGRRAAVQPMRFFHPQNQFLRARGAAGWDAVGAEGGEEEVYVGVKVDTVVCEREVSERGRVR
jgi:hypothetical protein